MLLEMETTKDPFCAHALVILNKVDMKSGFFHVLPIVSFHEIAPFISMNSGLDDAEAFNTSHIFSYLNCPIIILLMS